MAHVALPTLHFVVQQNEVGIRGLAGDSMHDINLKAPHIFLLVGRDRSTELVCCLEAGVVGKIRVDKWKRPGVEVLQIAIVHRGKRNRCYTIVASGHNLLLHHGHPVAYEEGLDVLHYARVATRGVCSGTRGMRLHLAIHSTILQ
jgi:hypothetical protein